jgi:hypothetical protein
MRSFEEYKIDSALVPQALNNSNVTGRYFKLDKYREYTGIVHMGAMAAATTGKLELLKATSRGGDDAAVVATVEFTANTGAQKINVLCATVITTDVLTINGKTLSVVASGGNAADMSVTVGGSDTLMAAAFAAAVNDPEYGISGIVASSSTGNLILETTDGDTTLTVSTVDSTMTISTLAIMAYADLTAGDLGADDGFYWVAPKVTTTANTVVCVTSLRGKPRFGVNQGAAASSVV